MMMKKMIEDQCPNCQHNGVMEDYEIYDNTMIVYFYCDKCEVTWKEYFHLTYDGYSMDGKVYDKDGNEDE